MPWAARLWHQCHANNQGFTLDRLAYVEPSLWVLCLSIAYQIRTLIYAQTSKSKRKILHIRGCTVCNLNKDLPIKPLGFYWWPPSPSTDSWLNQRVSSETSVYHAGIEQKKATLLIVYTNWEACDLHMLQVGKGIITPSNFALHNTLSSPKATFGSLGRAYNSSHNP